MDQVTIEQLRTRISQAVRDGHVHFNAAGERLDSINQIVETILRYGLVTVIPRKRYMLSKIDEQIDFSVPLSKLKICGDGALWTPKEGLWT